MEVRIGFPGGQNICQLFNFDIVNFLLKTNDGRDKRTNLTFRLDCWLCFG